MQQHLERLYDDWKSGRIMSTRGVPVCGEVIPVDIVYDVSGGMDGFSLNAFDVTDIFVRVADYRLYLCDIRGEKVYYFRLEKPYALRLPHVLPETEEQD